MTSNVIISEAESLVCVILSKTEQHVPYGELDGTTECVML
jgi:hypothetical protein